MVLIFIVTAHVKKGVLPLVHQSVCSIKSNHPDANIVVIDGDSEVTDWYKDIEPLNVHVIKPFVKMGGEINAFLYSIYFMDKNPSLRPTFVYLHDSVHVKKTLPIKPSKEFTSFWFAGRNSDNFVEDKEISNKFMINDISIAKDIEYIKSGHGNIVFGGMAVWNYKFVDKLNSHTNFVEISKHFNEKSRRIMWERILYIIAVKLGSISPREYRKNTICGDIYHHRHAFHNTDPYGESRNPYLTKIWSGR